MMSKQVFHFLTAFFLSEHVYCATVLVLSNIQVLQIGCSYDCKKDDRNPIFVKLFSDVK